MQTFFHRKRRADRDAGYARTYDDSIKTVGKTESRIPEKTYEGPSPRHGAVENDLILVAESLGRRGRPGQIGPRIRRVLRGMRHEGHGGDPGVPQESLSRLKTCLSDGKKRIIPLVD